MTVNQWIKRVAPISIGLVLIVLLAFSCSAINRDAVIPELSNPNDPFVTLNDITLTNQEIYQDLIDNYGVRVMNLSVVRDLLTNGEINYLELAKQDPEFDVQEALEEAIYDMPLAEAQNTYTPAQLAERVERFETILVLNGYASEEAFIEELYLEHARELYTRDQILSSNSITLQQVVNYYENSDYNEVCALVMRYQTLEAAGAAMSRQGLDPFNTSPVILLPEDEEVFASYLAIYNEAYGTNLEIDPANYQSCPDSSMVFQWDELSEDNPTLADLLFKELAVSPVLFPESTSDADAYTNIETVTVGGETSYYVIYKLSGDEFNDFLAFIPDIPTEELQVLLTQPASESGLEIEILDELIEAVAKEQASVDSQITSRINQLLQQSQLEVLDPFLYQNVISSMYQMEPNNGHPNLAYRYERNGELVTVSADAFFVELQRYAPAVAANALNNKVALENETVYAEVVTSELEDAALAQLQGFRDSFVAGEYEQFGFTPQTSRWEDFLYNGFGFRTETALYNAIISQEVAAAVLTDFASTTEQVNRYYDVMVEAYNDYFSVDLIHMLIYRDDNYDGVPDPLLSSTWSASELNTANEFANLLRARVAEESELQPLEFATFQAVVNEFNNASTITDPEDENYSVWARFKQAGFLLKTENLGTVEDGMMVGPFEDEARAMYDVMVDGVLRDYLSPNSIETIFGVHVIYGDNYELKLDAYPENDALSIPSRADLTLLIEGQTEELPEDVTAFFNAYFTPVRSQFDNAYRSVILDELRASFGTPSFTNPSLTTIYSNYVAANRVAAELQFNPAN